MKATKLIINGEEQSLCDCSNKVVVPVVNSYPENPVDGEMVIYDGALYIYYNESREEIVAFR